MYKSSDTPSWGQVVERPARSLPHRPPHVVKRFEDTLPGLGGERRRLARRKFQAELLIDPYDGAQPRCWVTTEDISRRGMFIIASHQYPLRSLLRLTLYTEYGELPLLGRVVHLIEGTGFGCEFIDLSEAQYDAIEFLVSMNGRGQ